MDRCFEFNIREHIFSLPRMILELSKAVGYKCLDLTEMIDIHSYHKIVLLCNECFFPAALSIAPLLRTIGIPVDILSESEALSQCTNIQKSHAEFADVLIFHVFPTLTTPDAISAMDNLRSQGAYIICLSDHHLHQIAPHVDFFWELTTPAMRIYLPVRNYTAVALAFLILVRIVESMNSRTSNLTLDVILQEIQEAAFLMIQGLNNIDSTVRDYAHSISTEKHIVFAGDNADYASACMANIFRSKYLSEEGPLLLTSDVLNDPNSVKDSCVVFFSSVYNPSHDKFKSSIIGNIIPAKSICIVTDDCSIISSSQHNVISIPLVNQACAQLFYAIVPSLLIGYLFP